MGKIFQIIMVGIDRKFILGNQKLPDGVEKIKIIYFELDPHAADVVFVFILKNRPYTYLLQSDLYAEQESSCCHFFGMDNIMDAAGDIGICINRFYNHSRGNR